MNKPPQKKNSPSLGSKKIEGILFATMVLLLTPGTKVMDFSTPILLNPSTVLSLQNTSLTIPQLKTLLNSLAPSKRQEVDLIARTVFGEARGEKSFESLQAIAHVILNRANDKRNWPSSVKDVVLQKNQFSCWNSNDPNYWAVQSVTLQNEALRQAYLATLCALVSPTDITKGANHYHANWVNPSWSRQKNMIRVAQINQHIFYKA